MIPIKDGEIHLWVADYESIACNILDGLMALLAPHELAQQRRFHFARDRRRYLVTRALVRTVLSRYQPVAPEAWQFTTNPYGRPEVANPEVHDLRLTFNLSHTHSLIVLGVAKERYFGVDIENIENRSCCLDLARQVFAPCEAVALVSLPHEEVQTRFFEYWTLKESYIKARGMGLSIPLDKFSYSFPKPGVVAIDIAADLGDIPERWQFWLMRPSERYSLALCAERLSVATVLVSRLITPDFEDVSVELPILRQG